MDQIKLPIYNNEAIACAIIGSFVRENDNLSLPKALLILPFVFDPKNVNYLKNRPTTPSLDLIISKNISNFVSFNLRYLEHLPTAINSLLILQNSKTILINNGQIKCNSIYDFNPSQKDNGNRFKEISRTFPTLNQIFENHTDSELYLKLKIEL